MGKNADESDGVDASTCHMPTPPVDGAGGSGDGQRTGPRTDDGSKYRPTSYGWTDERTDGRRMSDARGERATLDVRLRNTSAR